MIDTLVIKYGTFDNFVDDEVYQIKLDYSKCVQIITLEQGILQSDSENFLKSIDGEYVYMIYKGKSRVDNMNIFLISPIQVRRQIQLNKIL